MNLHQAVQILHRHNEYSEKEWGEAFKEIMMSGLSQFYKNYYERLFKRIKAGEVLV